MTINIREARENFAKIINQAQQGEEIVITRNGEPVARIVAPAQRSLLEPDELAAFRKSLDTPTNLPNAVLMSREEERY